MMYFNIFVTKRNEKKRINCSENRKVSTEAEVHGSSGNKTVKPLFKQLNLCRHKETVDDKTVKP